MMSDGNVTLQTTPEATAIAQIMRNSLEPRVVPVHVTDSNGDKIEASVLLAPRELVIHDLKPMVEHYRGRPERRSGTAKMTELGSFIAHVNRFKDAHSAIFADPDPDSPSLTCVLDYHPAGATSSPRFGRHRTVYEFPLSEEWEAWTKSDGQWMSVSDFALFMEDRVADIVDASSATERTKAFASKLSLTFASPQKMIELSRGLSVRVNARVSHHQNLQSGEGEITFAEEHQDSRGEQLKVPGAFIVQMSVFLADAAYQVPARLRYRVQQGQVLWSYHLYKPETVFDHALKTACEQAAKETNLPLLMGSPEA